MRFEVPSTTVAEIQFCVTLHCCALSRELLTSDLDCNSSPLASEDKGRGSTVLQLHTLRSLKSREDNIYPMTERNMFSNWYYLGRKCDVIYEFESWTRNF
jgi:hypothetical protein